MPTPTPASKRAAVRWIVIVAVALLALAILMMSSSETGESAEQSKADEYFQKAVAFQEQGHSVGAVENYRMAIKQDRSHPEACYRLALINFANKHYDRAGLLLDRALKRDTGNHLISYQLGLAFDRVSEPDSAAFYLRRAINLEPTFERAPYSLGLLWLNRQEPDSALKYLKQYVGLVPDDTQSAREVRLLIEGIESQQ